MCDEKKAEEKRDRVPTVQNRKFSPNQVCDAAGCINRGRLKSISWYRRRYVQPQHSLSPTCWCRTHPFLAPDLITGDVNVKGTFFCADDEPDIVDDIIGDDNDVEL